MDRTTLRALLTGSIVAGLLLGGVLGLSPRTAQAEDDAPEAETIEWVEGWEAGKARAEKDGKLMFVYFGRHTPR